MKKFTAILLAVVMLFALSVSAFAATNSLETDYAIGDGLGVVRAQEGQVAQLTKVHLDGHKLAVHINALDARRNAQAAQFFGQTGAHRTPEVGVIYSRCFHRDLLRF